MDLIQSFLGSIASAIGPFVPRVLAAIAIFAVALLAAKAVKAALLELTRRAKLDERLKSTGLGATFANVGYWLVWLLALPMLLGTLGLTALLEPVNNLLNQMFAFIPRLFGAVAVFAIGYLIANVVRQIVTGLLTAAGSEKLAAQLRMGDTLGKGGLAGIVGTILFVLIMLPVVAAALEPLGIEAVTRPVTNMLNTITDLIPKLAGAAIILVIAVVIGRVVSDIVARILAGVGLNSLPQKLGLGNATQAGGRSVSELAGTLLFAAIVLMALTQASDVLGFRLLTDAVAAFGVVGAQVFAGLLILVIGLWLSNIAATAVRHSDINNAFIISRIVRFAVLFFTVPLALRQMGLSAEIITIGFGAIMAAFAVAAAIAFGIGGRHTAGRLVDEAVRSMNAPGATDVTLPNKTE